MDWKEVKLNSANFVEQKIWIRNIPGARIHDVRWVLLHLKHVYLFFFNSVTGFSLHVLMKIPNNITTATTTTITCPTGATIF